MTYAASEGFITAALAALGAVLVALIGLAQAMLLKRAAKPLAATLQTIQVNTDGRLDELIRLNRAQRDAHAAGEEVSDNDAARLTVALGEPAKAAPILPAEPLTDHPDIDQRPPPPTEH